MLESVSARQVRCQQKRRTLIPPEEKVPVLLERTREVSRRTDALVHNVGGKIDTFAGQGFAFGRGIRLANLDSRVRRGKLRPYESLGSTLQLASVQLNASVWPRG